MDDDDFEFLNPPLGRDSSDGCFGCLVWILAIVGFVAILKWIF